MAAGGQIKEDVILQQQEVVVAVFIYATRSGADDGFPVPGGCASSLFSFFL